MGGLLDELDARLRASATQARAVQEKRYLKSDLTHYGTTVPDIRAAVRATLKAAGDLTHDELLHLVTDLWAKPVHEQSGHEQPVHERRTAAAIMLVERSNLLTLDDAPHLERLLRESRTWALIDPLSGDAIGPAFERFGGRATPLYDRWAQDDDFWIRRSALLVHLRPLRAGEGDWDRFARYADAMLEEKEFFIRKAIGWILRDTSARRPDLVFDWVLPRTARVSGVTLREATKYLSVQQAATIRSRGQNVGQSG